MQVIRSTSRSTSRVQGEEEEEKKEEKEKKEKSKNPNQRFGNNGSVEVSSSNSLHPKVY